MPRWKDYWKKNYFGKNWHVLLRKCGYIQYMNIADNITIYIYIFETVKLAQVNRSDPPLHKIRKVNCAFSGHMHALYMSAYMLYQIVSKSN